MAITNIKVSNFKSFKDLDLNLGRFNVVIGANASGKSNFVEVFRFLKSIEENGIEDAVSLHGGSNSIVNRRLGSLEPVRMRATSDRQMRWGDVLSDVRASETTYDFSLRFARAQGILIENDHLSQKYQLKVNGEDAEARLDIVVSEGKPKVSIDPSDFESRIKKYLLKDASSSKFYTHLKSVAGLVEMRRVTTLLINTHLPGFLMEQWEGLFRRLGVYNIDPHVIKKPQEMTGIPRLQENGENLVFVLKQILADPEKSRKFHNLLRYLLPFAVEVGIEPYQGTSLLLGLREEYYEGSLLANLLSDGTVDAAALVTALFFEDKDVIIIEEPERNVHPHLISGLMELMKDASRNKQIILTTHSPEVVKHAGVENLLLISRDKEGFSTVSRPADKEAVKIFLENNLGLEEVFVQELWGP